jgi:hypothetical protein
MTGRAKFDRYMVAAGAARHVKFRRLSTQERHAFFMGVLSIAAQSPVRGCLLVGDLPAEAADIAQEADVHVKFAASALEKLREVGVIYTDEELGCERVHDFKDWNPAPKRDATAADRMQRYRDRKKVRDGVTVTRNARNDNAALREEVEVEVEVPRNAPRGESAPGRVITFRRRRRPEDTRTLAEAILEEFNHQAGTNYGAYTAEGSASEDLKRILGAISDAAPPLTLLEAKRVIHWRLTAPRPFWTGRPHTGVVFGPNVFPSNRESAVNPTTNTPSSADIAAALARKSTTPAA